MEWLKGLGTGAFGIVAALAGLALFVAFAIPLGHWTWEWVAGGNNALVVIALAMVGGVGLWANRSS